MIEITHQGNEPGMTLFPQTKSGKWSGYFYLAAIATFTVGFVASITSSAPDFGPLILWAFFFVTATALGVVGLLLSLVAMIKEKEKSILTYLPWVGIILLGLFYTLVPLGMNSGVLSTYYCLSEDGHGFQENIWPFCPEGYRRVDSPPDWAKEAVPL